MTITVVGGAYQETCEEPTLRWTYGSGVRAAAVLGDACERLVTVADTDTLAVVHAVLGGRVPVEATARSGPVTFRYYTALHRPHLQRSPEDTGIEVADVDARAAVVFGMVEATPTVTAEMAVVDPQHSLPLDDIPTTVRAARLAVVANRHEVRRLARTDSIADAARLVMAATGAQVVVVKAGALGALVFAGDDAPAGVPAHPTPTVFPIGSGDVFTAAFAERWHAGDAPIAAAAAASRRTAGYVWTRQTGPADTSELTTAPVPTPLSVETPPGVYVAASFENAEQRWSASTVADGISDIGGRSLYPLRDLGRKQTAQTTAAADLEALEACDSVVVLADVARAGPFFEAGWAASRGLPVVVASADKDPDRFTMMRGTGASVAHDLASAVYQAVWKAVEHRHGPRDGRLLLLSGGVDSTAVAAVERPERALFVDYGQLPAEAERAAAHAVAEQLDIPLAEMTVDLAAVGSGLLAGLEPDTDAPTPEWFPYRNQFLVTVAAAYAVQNGLDTVVLAVVGGDGARHLDGTATFVRSLDRLLQAQEHAIRAVAPHVHTPPVELLAAASLPDAVLKATFSCHTSNTACGACPGCERRSTLLQP